MATTRPIAGQTFRAGRGFELVAFDRLPPGEQAALAELTAEPDFYGVLKPRQGSGQTIKSVNKDTALLWLTLQSPGPLPYFATAREPQAASGAIWQLVLDGVLEVEIGGDFVGGAHAAELLAGGQLSQPLGRLAELSRLALRYAERSRLHNAGLLSGFLYRFGTQPISPRWQAQLPGGDAVLSFVGAGPGTDVRRLLDAQWDAVHAEAAGGWLVWSRRGRAQVSAGAATYKLYISPQPQDMPCVFAAVADTLPARVTSFKIGANAAGLLRPDKMVLYFADQEGLQAGAAELADRLAGVPAHGVPFSAEISAAGLLSWGMDPPRRERRLAWQSVQSWRSWVVSRLAVALVAAGSSALERMTAVDFALERLKHEGVDIDHWMPSMRLWRGT